MDSENKLWIVVVLLALLNIVTSAYLFYATNSLNSAVTSADERTASLQSSFSAYVSEQNSVNGALQSAVLNASSALDKKIFALGGRMDQSTAQIQSLSSRLDGIDKESAEKYESLSGKITGLEELSKDLDVESLKNAVVVVYEGGNVIGSGTMVSSDGYVLTNKHVINGVSDPDSLRVESYGGRKYRAEVTASSSQKDLALLSISDVENLAYMTFEDVANIKTGDKVYAIGNPLGEELTRFTVTEGIISGFRTEDNIDYVQTDAALNPGNSGGPLINKAGKAVGLVSMGYVDAEGLSFAIRSDVVQGFLDEKLP